MTTTIQNIKTVAAVPQEQLSLLETLVPLIQSFQLEAIEKLLGNDIPIMGYGKYYFLAILRDIFSEYAQLGDTHLNVYTGGCYNKCSRIHKRGYLFEGNFSKTKFSFMSDKGEEGLRFMHFCSSITTDCGIKGDDTFTLKIIFKKLELEKSMLTM